MIIRNNLDYDRACKVAGTHPVKTTPNLYLRVGAAKKKNAPDEPDRIIGRRWLFRYTMNSKRRDMRIHVESLAEARAEAALQKRLVRQGIDPLEKRNAEKAAARIEAAKAKAGSAIASRTTSRHTARDGRRPMRETGK